MFLNGDSSYINYITENKLIFPRLYIIVNNN